MCGVENLNDEAQIFISWANQELRGKKTDVMQNCPRQTRIQPQERTENR